nr:uncharacterized protein LOC128779763 [Desmodus rotundus]
MCHAREQLGDLPHPAPTPFLPRPLPRPVRPLPACPATPWPAGPLRAARRVGWRAGGQRTAGYPAPDMAHPTWAPLPPGWPGKEGEAAEGAGARRMEIRVIPASPPLRHAGDCAAVQLAWTPRSSQLPLSWGLGTSLRTPLSPPPPQPLQGLRAQLLPTRSPGPVAVTLAVPAQRPAACSATPGGWEGSLHPRSISPLRRCSGTLMGQPLKSKACSGQATGVKKSSNSSGQSPCPLMLQQDPEQMRKNLCCHGSMQPGPPCPMQGTNSGW